MTWTIERIAEWCDGVGIVVYWHVLDDKGSRVARFSEREDAEECLAARRSG